MFNIETPILTDKDRESCEGFITMPELQAALNDMEPNKSPGLDGLTSNFYKHFWDILGNELTTVYNYAFEHELLSVTQRRGVITLVFKKNDRTRLKNWRPISLLTTDYKILTKALANRLKQVLPTIIHTDQTACIKGRTINDNASLIRDAIYFANETNAELAIITVDQLKAFDRVDHDFLFKTLKKFGFGSQFIKWIKLLYNQVCSSVKVNGWMTAFINLGRGLRQGCPLSMPLYILTAEILATHIRANKLIQGLKLPNSVDEVKITQYADDTTLLLVNDNSIKETFKTFEMYERASGAKINVEKCKGLWTGKYKDRTDQLLGFDWYNDYIPEKILGIFFGNIDCTAKNLEGKIQKLEGIINAWTHRDLSFKGKALVINGLLTSILWYTATTIHIPPQAIQDLEQIIYRFFWNKKAPLTNRDVLALPLAQGGFNIQRIELKIQALRLNTLRRLLEPEPAHWKRLTEYFLTISNTKQRKITLTQSYTPKDIDRNIPKFHKELLTTWYKYAKHTERTNKPKQLVDILNEPLFKNLDITDSAENKPVLYKDWVAAGITKIRDITCEVVPGFLPAKAIHEILGENDEEMTKTIRQTTRELDDIIHALPENWKARIQHTQTEKGQLELCTQPSFQTDLIGPGGTVKDITQLKTRNFYQQLRDDQQTTIPALEYWKTKLKPTPEIDQRHWKTTYSKLITNKQGDINWKISLRILPSAQGLYRMRVYHTNLCHHCGNIETIEHVLVNCTNTKNLWTFITTLTDKISEHKLQLNDSTKILGLVEQKNDGLNDEKRQLINWILTTARCALHKSAVDYRVRGEDVKPRSLFVATAKSHITYEYKRAQEQNKLTQFKDQWCDKEALAKIVNNKLIFNF